MKFLLLPVVLLVSCLTAAPLVLAHDYQAGTLSIHHPWTRATPGGAKVAGGYMTITNNGTESDRLIGGSVSIAGRFEIHEMKMDGNVMRMRMLPSGLEIKPGDTLKLEPGGYHAMFMDLKEPVKEGTLVSGRLVFEKAGAIDVEYKAEPIGSGGASHQGHGASGHGGHGKH